MSKEHPALREGARGMRVSRPKRRSEGDEGFEASG
jgi:hypothetical protein